MREDVELREVQATSQEALNFILALLKAIEAKCSQDYIEESMAFVKNTTSALFTYHVPDKISDSVKKELKSSGIPFMLFDNDIKPYTEFIIPEEFVQHLEAIAMQVAVEHDHAIRVSVDEINDLCFNEMRKNVKDAAYRYELTVDDVYIANNIRDQLTKNPDLKCAFAMEENEDKTVTFYTQSKDVEKLNKAVFRAEWQFAGKFAALNRKYEEQDIKRQKEVDNRLEENGHYYIVDAKVDEKTFRPTGEYSSKIEITDEEICFYKNGEQLTERIANDGSGQCIDMLNAWLDSQVNSIVVEANDIERSAQIIREKMPTITLSEEDKILLQNDQEKMLSLESRLNRCISDSFNTRSVAEIVNQIKQVSIDKTDVMNEKLSKLSPVVKEITAGDLKNLDRVIEITREHLAELEKEEKIKEKERRVMSKGQSL